MAIAAAVVCAVIGGDIAAHAGRRGATAWCSCPRPQSIQVRSVALDVLSAHCLGTNTEARRRVRSVAAHDNGHGCWHAGSEHAEVRRRRRPAPVTPRQAAFLCASFAEIPLSVCVRLCTSPPSPCAAVVVTTAISLSAAAATAAAATAADACCCCCLLLLLAAAAACCCCCLLRLLLLAAAACCCCLRLLLAAACCCCLLLLLLLPPPLLLLLRPYFYSQLLACFFLQVSAGLRAAFVLPRLQRHVEFLPNHCDPAQPGLRQFTLPQPAGAMVLASSSLSSAVVVASRRSLASESPARVQTNVTAEHTISSGNRSNHHTTDEDSGYAHV
jgi:hypothetical protein